MVSIAGVEPGPHGGQIPLDGADHAERQDLGRCQNRCWGVVRITTVLMDTSS